MPAFPTNPTSPVDHTTVPWQDPVTSRKWVWVNGRKWGPYTESAETSATIVAKLAGATPAAGRIGREFTADGITRTPEQGLPRPFLLRSNIAGSNNDFVVECDRPLTLTVTNETPLQATLNVQVEEDHTDESYTVTVRPRSTGGMQPRVINATQLVAAIGTVMQPNTEIYPDGLIATSVQPGNNGTGLVPAGTYTSAPIFPIGTPCKMGDVWYFFGPFGWDRVSGSLDTLTAPTGGIIRPGQVTTLNPYGIGYEIVCSLAYVDLFMGGEHFALQQDGVTVRSVHHCLLEPNDNMDAANGYVAGSRRTHDDGRVWVCEDPTIGGAVWRLQTRDALTGEGSPYDALTTRFPLNFPAEGGITSFTFSIILPGMGVSENVTYSGAAITAAAACELIVNNAGLVAEMGVWGVALSHAAGSNEFVLDNVPGGSVFEFEVTAGSYAAVTGTISRQGDYIGQEYHDVLDINNVIVYFWTGTGWQLAAPVQFTDRGFSFTTCIMDFDGLFANFYGGDFKFFGSIVELDEGASASISTSTISINSSQININSGSNVKFDEATVNLIGGSVINITDGSTIYIAQSCNLTVKGITCEEPSIRTNAGVIPQIASVCLLSGFGTMTLPNGLHGQKITLIRSSITGGNAVVTATTKTGWTTSITSAALGDVIVLQYFATLGWVILNTRGSVTVV